MQIRPLVGADRTWLRDVINREWQLRSCRLRRSSTRPSVSPGSSRRVELEWDLTSR